MGRRTLGCDSPYRSVQAKYRNSFQLTHMPCGNHAQSIASNGDRKEDKTLLQHSQLSQHGEFWHVSVSERQRPRLCGQNLCVPFLRTVLPPEVERALEQWRPTARQKRSYLHHRGEFQHQLFTFRSVHDSDHGGVVRISLGQSQTLLLFISCWIYLFTRHNFSPTRSVTSGTGM